MLSRRHKTLVLVLLPALLAPDIGYRLVLELEESVQSANAMTAPDTGQEPPGDQPADDRQSPIGVLAPQPAAFEQIQRTMRLAAFSAALVRPYEKHLAGSESHRTFGTRRGPFPAWARCVATSMSTVASLIQAHAPPRFSPTLQH